MDRACARPPAARRSAFGRAGALPDDCDRHNKFVEAAEKAREKAYGGKLGTAAVDAGVGYISDKVTAQLDRKGTRWAIRKLPRWATRGIWKGRKAAAVAGAVAEGLHGMMLAFSIKVEASDSMLEGHYGHGGPGEPLVFKVRVHSLDDYGALAAKCGKLAGKELPRAGGIEGVTMIWEQAERELTPLHGTVDCSGGATPCRSKTRADGVATLTFTPNAESGPPVGITREATGVLNGIALYQSALDSGLPGMVAQVITPKYDGTLWKLQYHHARGMRIQSNWHWARDTDATRGYHNGAIDTRCAGRIRMRRRGLVRCGSSAPTTTPPEHSTRRSPCPYSSCATPRPASGTRCYE